MARSKPASHVAVEGFFPLARQAAGRRRFTEREAAGVWS